MHRGTLLVVVLALPACGRLGFDEQVRDAVTGDVLADAPPLPSTIVCTAARRLIAPVAMNADFAIAPNGAGVTWMWIDSGGNVRAFVGDLVNPSMEFTAVPGPVDGIAGIEKTSVGTLFVTYAGATQTLWLLSGTTAVSLRTESTVAGTEPFMNDATGIPRTWMRGEAGGLRATFVDDAGVLKTDATFPTIAPVTALSAAPINNHGHVTWSEDRGGGVSVCSQADIDFPNGTAPVFGASGTTATDCFDPRIDSGPAPTDSIATVYRTSVGAVEIRYLGATVDSSQRLSDAGRAPKIRFDGTTFWVAWIDQLSLGGGLRVAKVAQDLTFSTVDLSGWNPVGDGAFELVRANDGRVYLGLLSADSVSLLRTCP